MLVLSRRIDQAVRIDGNVTVRVLGIRNGQVSLGFSAPREIKIFREEVLRAVALSNERAQLCGREPLRSMGAENDAGNEMTTTSTPEQPSAGDGAAAPDTVHVASARFGTFDVPVERLFTLEEGLIGFPGARRHALLDHRPRSSFKWMLCVDAPELGFVVADAADFVPGYVAPTEHAADLLGCSAEDVASFVLVTIPPEPREIFLNLLAPVVVDVRRRRGLQLVLEGDAPDPAYRVALADGATA